MPRTSHVAVVAIAVFVAFVVLIVGDFVDGRALTVIDDVVFVVLTVPAAVFAALTARSLQGRARLAWVAVTVGVAGWGIGEAIWSYYEVRLRELPYPSIAEVGFLLLPAGACVALLVFPVEHHNQSRARLFLDGVIMAGSLFLVSWVTILYPLYQSGAASWLAFVVALAYPISDVLVLTVAGVVLVRSVDSRRLPLTLLTAGLACFALSDSAFVYLSAKGQYGSGNVIDIGWAAGLLLITVAAAAGREGVRRQRDSLALPGWASVWLPYTPLLVAGVVAAAQPVPLLQSGPVIAVAGTLVVTVLARQFLAVRENRRLVAKVAVQALHDPLTGLANRALFNERLEHAMQLHGRHDLAPAIVSLDLNDFKLVNDNLGHPVGDQLLVAVADRLLDSVRLGDTVARLGGDEFAVLIEASPEAADDVARRVVEAFEEPFLLAGHELLMRPSVGLAIAGPHESDLSADDLLRRADVAMYSAKRSRLRGVQSYEPDLEFESATGDDRQFGSERMSSSSASLELLEKLRRAIESRELTLVYQPKFDLRTADVVGVEALLRWPRPDGSALGPEEFLPVVRRHGLMGQVTQLVISTALDDALVWHRAGLQVPVAVNLFAPSMANVGLPAKIAHALAERGLSPAALTVEITEDLFLDNIERAQSVLEQLRHNGIRISIDDFGSGYSALSYLRDLPIDEVKLDRSFIASVPVDQRAAAVVQAVVDLAHVLGLTVVVEGVEDADTAALVRRLGCDIGQGFYFGMPVGPDEVPGLASLLRLP